MPGVVTSDCLFDKKFKRMFEKDGWSGDIKEPGLMNGRAAYTNTVRMPARRAAPRAVHVPRPRQQHLTAHACN